MSENNLPQQKHIVIPTKDGLSPSKKLYESFDGFNQSFLRMMKNDFYFILTAFFVLKVFKFCPEFLVMWKSNLIKKAKVSFKIYDVTTWGPTIATHILLSISRSKGNLIVKFAQLIKYDVRNIFPQDHAKMR